MAHPSRGRINTRAYRSVPKRVAGRLLNRDGDVLVYVSDMLWTAVSANEFPQIVNLDAEMRTWKLPTRLLDGITPRTSYMIREVESDHLWEIQQVAGPSNDLWICPAVRMHEHNEVIP